MSAFFNSSRFLALFRFNYRLNKRTYLIELAAFTGLAFAFTGAVFISYQNIKLVNDFYNIFYFVLLQLTGAYYANKAFSGYQKTATAYSGILLPTSNFEKFLLPTLFSGVVFFILFSLLFNVLANATSYLWSLIYHYSYSPFHLFSNPNQNSFLPGLFFFLLVNPVFMLGSIAFKKNNFFYTGLLFFLFLILFLMFGHLFSTLLFGTEKFSSFYLFRQNTLG